MWLPRFVCPHCFAFADEGAFEAIVCRDCHRRFERRNGSYCFLTPARVEAAMAFVRQYLAVRQQDGYRQSSARYFQMLPYVPPGDPHAGEWRVRRESYQHLLRRVLPAYERATTIRVLDLGSGNGWLSHRLASFGHRAVAVDWLDDEADGLGACRHYEVPFPTVQADFDALPLRPFQFELVVFNASLHYSSNILATLAHARRMLAPGGSLVVMDSPMFLNAEDGEGMIGDAVRRFRTRYGLPDAERTNVGYLTFATMSQAAVSLGLRAQFFPSGGSLGWRVRRNISRLRLGRAPAAFGAWVAQ